jgi:tetratricopeptide (TPR) repeat protein
MWHGYEHPNNANFYFYRSHSLALRATFLPFRLLGPLAIIGMLLALPGLRSRWPLYLLALTLTVPLLAFYTICRFRVPLAAALVPFAAFAVVRLAAFIGARRWKVSAAIVVALACLVAWASIPRTGSPDPIRFDDYIQPYRLHFYEPSREARRQEDWQRLRSLLSEALRYAPDYIREQGPAFDRSDPERRRLAEWYGPIYQELSWAHFRMGESEEALAHAGWAARLDPEDLDYVYRQGRDIQQLEDYSQSLAWLEIVEGADPHYESTLFLKGFALQMMGDLSGSIETYRQFLERNPTHYQARFNLAHALMTTGDCDSAVVEFKQVLVLKPDYREVHLHLERCGGPVAPPARRDRE